MSNNLPFDIQAEIMNMLPVKSLIQFRSVSKSWKSHIDSSDFIAHYSSQQQHLLVRYQDSADLVEKYVSIADDDTFPQYKVSLTVPLLVNRIKYPFIIGNSHGLLCLYDCYHETPMAILWNISIRKVVAVVVPAVVSDEQDVRYRTTLGFGVCPGTIDPKIVKVINRWNFKESTIVPWQVEVFTLSTGAWRSSYSTNIPSQTVDLSGLQVDLDGFLYGLAVNWIPRDGGFTFSNVVISFDMTSEEFREINVPDSLARSMSVRPFHISKLRKSLVVLELDGYKNLFFVWMMDHGHSKSFTKLFTIYAPDARILSVLAFRKSGEPMIEIERHCSKPLSPLLVVYEPYSKHIDDIGINVTSKLPLIVSSYMETLLLVDQPNFIMYDKGKRYLNIHSTGTHLKYTDNVYFIRSKNPGIPCACRGHQEAE
ncbi:hypothetical protein L1987_65252 [Smallanthus sonchifolius]|uniref:Uncharacterized protein n=1 Tax=Smallanthus sonchifolius TaxID=185202 RepID=A0ACB9BTU3_9ASTR|nr:hypothetical protein L1987_65252 [Smallanthus sonchifolius]